MPRALLHWLAWLATLALLCALAWWRVAPSGPIQTDILQLLPQDSADATLDAANRRSRDAFSQQMLVLVRGADDARTRTAAQAAHASLRAAGLTSAAGGDTFERALDVYRQHGFALLSPERIARLRDKGASALATDVAVALASPAGMVGLGNDPGGYVRDFVGHLPRPYPDFLPDGDLLSATRGAERVFLLRMSLPDAAFGSAGAAQAVNAIASARAAVASACADCRLQATGAALFTAAASAQAHREAVVLGVTSTLLIMILIAWAYRSLAPHLLGFLQLGASVTAATAAVIAVFGSIHVLTLVFGTTLLGIAIDYAFLYFSEYWFGGGAPRAVWRTMRAGLGVGLLTGVAAFAFLALTGFPALSQMAVFSIAGLIEAALVVALIFPVSLTAPPRVPEHALLRWSAGFFAIARQPGPWRRYLPLLALVIAALGAWRIHAHDDVRELSRLSPQLLAADQEVRTTLGRYPAPGYFLISAPDAAQALTREAELTRRLQARLPQASVLGLSRFLPPPAQQQASLSAWADVFADAAGLRKAFVDLGLPAALADHIEAGWQAARHTPLQADALFAALPDLRHFQLPTPDGTALMATVFGARDLNAASLRAAADGIAGVRFVEPITRIDALFTGIRVRAMWLVLLGYLAISAILIWRYRWREALRMLYPPVLAMALTLGALGWLGVSLNIFSVVALILILGLGRDYAVFLREAGAGDRPAALTVLLSAATTIIGFGLLAFSETPALQSFGLATGLGIFFSYLVTPLSLPPQSGESA
jgi:predicted exporter